MSGLLKVGASMVRNWLETWVQRKMAGPCFMYYNVLCDVFLRCKILEMVEEEICKKRNKNLGNRWNIGHNMAK